MTSLNAMNKYLLGGGGQGFSPTKSPNKKKTAKKKIEAKSGIISSIGKTAQKKRNEQIRNLKKKQKVLNKQIENLERNNIFGMGYYGNTYGRSVYG